MTWMGGRRPAARAARMVLGLLALVAAGCQVVDLVPATPAPEPQSITDCEPPFVLNEEATLGGIGLGDLPGIGDAEATQRGLIRITRAVVPWEAFGPPGLEPVVAEGQMLCVTWPDGGGLAMLLPRPFGLAADEQATGPVSGPSWTLPPLAAAALFALLALIGVSWLAFRDRGTRRPPLE